MSTTAATVKCKTTRWSQSESILRAIRTEVFIQEQKVDVSEEWDIHDQSAEHYLLYHNNNCVGCARLIKDTWQHAPALHIGRVAILKPWRGIGLGKYLMAYILNTVASKYSDSTPVYLHAQVTVIPFYTKLGFTQTGEEFLDAGIWHQTMLLNANGDVA